MKKIWILLLAAGFMTACNNESGDKAQTASTEEQSNPGDPLRDTARYTSIEWLDSTFQDVGEIKKGQKLEMVYNFRNSGQYPLVIVRAEASCGCTKPEVPKEPIAPGASGKIRSVFNSAGQHIGEHRKDIYVTANSKPDYQTRLSFKVQVTE